MCGPLNFHRATIVFTQTPNDHSSTGTTKVSAIRNLAPKVAMVDSQISDTTPLFLDSSAMCMPKASDMASAIAIVRMPPTTTVREWVPEWSPTINPNVVITPDVRPKLSPVFNDGFIINLHCRCPTQARGARLARKARREV